MNNSNELTCFSLTCSFIASSEEELEKHEQKHKAELEKLKQEDDEDDPKEDDCI